MKEVSVKKDYVSLTKEKIANISNLIRPSSFSIVIIKNYYFGDEVFSTISHIYETDVGKSSFERYVESAIKASLHEDANRKIKNVKFYEEEKILYVTNDENGKVIFKEINERNIFSFIKPNLEDYFTDFMFFPIVELDEFFLNNAGFSKLKKIHNIVGLGFLLTYDYKF